MYIEATVNEITREIKWDKSQAAAVDGDFAVGGFRFKPLNIDQDNDLTEGTWYVVFEDVRAASHSNKLGETDANGIVTWEFDDNITKLGGGVVKFFLKVVETSGETITKRWNSNICQIRVNTSINYNNDEEEAERESEIDRLAGLIETLTETASTVNDVERVLENLTSSRPQVVSEVVNLRNADRDKLAVVAGNGYLYYYDYVVGDWLQMFKYGDGGVELDQTCTDDTKAAPAGEVGRIRARVTTAEEDVTQIKEDLSAKTGLSEEMKQALLACFAKVAWTDEHGQDYVDALEDALYPPVDLARITAVYTQSGTVYDIDSLDVLKPDLVVTAHYTNGTSGVVTGYALSGTLAEGTSAVTVAYGGKTTAFNVVVSGLTLDDIAYNNLTYRDVFITNNEVSIGDFEGDLNISSTTVNLENNYYYKANAGTPIQTLEACVSPTQSLKCYGNSSTQIEFGNTSKIFNPNQKYLACACVNVKRYLRGYAGAQFNLSFALPTVMSIETSCENVTDGFEPIVKMITPIQAITGFRFFIGSYSNANLDCYVDDIIFTPVPNTLTESEALVLYKKYLKIRRKAV